MASSYSTISRKASEPFSRPSSRLPRQDSSNSIWLPWDLSETTLKVYVDVSDELTDNGFVISYKRDGTIDLLQGRACVTVTVSSANPPSDWSRMLLSQTATPLTLHTIRRSCGVDLSGVRVT